MAEDSSVSVQPFVWPEGKRAALSLTFDDARTSQVDVGLPILEEHGTRATFYVTPANVEQRLDGWRRAALNGHEIGNHTFSHPCSGNFPWSRQNALEDYSLTRMEEDIVRASRALQELLDVTPATFAYPCGATFVGRGEEVVSYVPLVARLFLVGRGGFDARWNDPVFCDLTQVGSCGADGVDFTHLRNLLDSATREGGWLLLFSHEVGREGRQTTRSDVLDAVCRHAKDPVSGLWVDTVAAVGRYIDEARKGSTGRK